MCEKWSTNIPPRSYGANRSTPGKTLQAWIDSHGGFTEESLEALQALQEAWFAEQPGPSSPLKTPRARAKRRRRSAPPPSKPTFGEHDILTAHYESAPAQHLTWSDIHALQGRACLTERHIPQACFAMIGGLLRHLLSDQDPIAQIQPSLTIFYSSQTDLAQTTWQGQVETQSQRNK